MKYIKTPVLCLAISLMATLIVCSKSSDFDSSSGYIYAGGYSRNSSDTLYAGYWKNGVWTGLPNGEDSSNTKGAYVSKLTADTAGNVYAGGYSKNSTGVTYAGYWKNGAWVELPNGMDSSNTKGAAVNTLAANPSGNVYAGGYSINSSGIIYAGYWKNGAWVELPNGVDSSNTKGASVSKLTADTAGNVYAGGYSVNSSGVNYAGYWKNGAWTGLPNGEDSSNTYGAMVLSLVLDSSDVYAGGRSYNSSNVCCAGYWKNGVWTGLPNGVDSSNTKGAAVISLVVDSSGNVYAGGYSCNSTGVTYAGYWKNGVWTGLPNGEDSSNTKGAYVSSLVLDSSDVYAGGYSCNSSGVNCAGYWKNGVWTGLPNGEDSSNTKGAAVTSILPVLQ